jgi:hypothetical protein
LFQLPLQLVDFVIDFRDITKQVLIVVLISWELLEQLAHVSKISFFEQLVEECAIVFDSLTILNSFCLFCVADAIMLAIRFRPDLAAPCNECAIVIRLRALKKVWLR